MTATTSTSGSHTQPSRRGAGGLLVVALVLVALLPGVRAAALEPPPAPPVELTAILPAVMPDPQVAAWIVVDLTTGQVLSGAAIDERRPVASTIKVLTALSVVTRAPLTERVTVGSEVAGATGSTVSLSPGDTWTVGELLDGLVSRSGNDAADALAVHVGGDLDGFLALMGEDAEALGLGALTLTSASGLGDGNLLSARDLATIARVALADPVLAPVLGRRTVTLPGLGEVETRNELLLRDPTATGVKTGFTTAAGYSLIASVERDDRGLLAVVLGADEDPARFDLAEQLLELAASATRVAEATADLEVLIAGGGAVAYRLAPVALTVPTAASLAVVPVLPDRPEVSELPAALHLDAEVVGDLQLVRTGATAPAAAAAAAAAEDGAIARALADGLYAVLRATTREDLLR